MEIVLCLFRLTLFTCVFHIVLGYKYAMMSLKIMLIHLLTNYKFTTKIKMEEIRPAVDVHCHITVPHLVSIEERKFYD